MRSLYGNGGELNRAGACCIAEPGQDSTVCFDFTASVNVRGKLSNAFSLRRVNLYAKKVYTRHIIQIPNIRSLKIHSNIRLTFEYTEYSDIRLSPT